MLRHDSRRMTERALGGSQVARLAKEESQPLQCERGDTVARGHGFICERLWPVHERFMLVRREPEPARFGVVEVSEQDVRQALRERQVPGLPVSLQQLEHRVEQERMIVEI